MAVLQNKRHEKFALNVLKGMSLHDAALDASYSAKTVDQTASRLFRNVKIVQRILELGKMAESDGIMSVRERKEKLSEIGRGSLPDFMTPEGIKVTKDSPNVGAVSELTTVTRVFRKSGDPVVITKVKTHPPVPAIDLLNKMDRIYGEEIPAGDVVQNFIFVLPDGTRIMPAEFNKPKELTGGNGSREGD